MSGHNVNIYFQEKNYNKIKPLIEQRKVSEFVNKIVEKELEREQGIKKEQLKKQLITAHKRVAKNKKEMAIWDETVDDYINKKQ